MKHLGTKTLESERLILRRFEMSDADLMFRNWAGDHVVTEYLTWPTHQNISVTESILKEWTSQYVDKGFYQWAIVLKSNPIEPIGSIGVVKKDEQTKMVHVGYCIGKEWWNQGITSEALTRIIDFFFKELGANRIEANHDPRNSNSGKVMEKCGLVYEGTLKEGGLNNQGICDLSIYGLVAKDYFK